MSTLSKVNFEPTSDIMTVHRRDFPLADPTLAQPTNAVALVDGEWMTLNTSGQMIRASNIAVGGNAATVRSFPLFAERGRYDVQAVAGTKAPLLFLGQYECDTRIFDATAVVGGGAAITTAFQPLKVATVTFSGRNFTGLVGHGGAADTNPVVGYVVRLPANNGGKLRFIQGWRQLAPDPPETRRRRTEGKDHERSRASSQRHVHPEAGERRGQGEACGGWRYVHPRPPP